jgi:RNA polymerase sigma-70 factor, ECF subfamily
MTSPRKSARSPGLGPWDATDPPGFAAQYRAAYSRLALVAAGVTGDRSSAEDIVQDAAVIALEKASEFRPGSNFAAWMAEIVRRCALNHRRKAKGRRTFAADPAVLSRMDHRTARASGGGVEHGPIATPAGEVLEHQSAFDDELVRALKELSEDARCCLLLRTVEKLSYAEIAALMRIPEGTAMSHVHRSRATLRVLLAPEAAASGASERKT